MSRFFMVHCVDCYTWYWTVTYDLHPRDLCSAIIYYSTTISAHHKCRSLFVILAVIFK